MKLTKKLLFLFIIPGIYLLSGCQNNKENDLSAGNDLSATCDPTLGPCAGTKEKAPAFKDNWPSYDAVCSGQKCKVILSNDYVQVGGTKIPRAIATSYEMVDNSNYNCTSSFTGGACKPILVGSIYYKGKSDSNEKAVVFGFKSYKPAKSLNIQMKEWFGDQ